LALAVAFAALGGGVQRAAACSCVQPENAAKMTDKELLSWRLERATDVVRGRIVDVQAGEDTKRNGFRVVTARMKVTSIVKGDASIGNATLVTGFGTGDCGIPHMLLYAVARDSDVTFSVKKDPATPGEFWVDMCGYGTLDPVPTKSDPN
jgi:hypothetical protein